MRRLWMAGVAVLVLAGCNTMLNDSYQKIVVHTPGVQNADCVLETEKNKYRALTPAVVMVERSRLPMAIKCHKASYIDSVVTIDSRVRMAGSQLNVFNGFVPGTAYDIASQSIYAYPDAISVPMRLDPDRLVLQKTKPAVLQKKQEAIKPPAPSPAAKEETDKSFSKSLRK